jgi:hypothetical protein
MDFKDLVIKNNVLFGTHDWLFLYGGDHSQFDYLTGKKQVSTQAKELFSKNMIYRKRLCESKGAQFLHVVFPCKPIVRTEFVPLAKREIKPIFDTSLKTDDVIYPLESLVADLTSFYKSDTHTSHRGSLIILDIILAKLGINLNYSPTFKSAKKLGDLTRMLNMDFTEEVQNFVGIEGQSIRTLDVTNKAGLKGNSGIIRITKSPNALLKKRILIFGDSFFNNNMIKIMTCFFEEITFFRSPILIECIVDWVAPDIVLTGQAERYTSSAIDDQGQIFPIINYMNANFYDSSKVGNAFFMALNAVFSKGRKPEVHEAWSDLVASKLQG